MPRVLLIDNFDSFTFNLVQQIASLGAEVFVLRNDLCLQEMIAVNPTHLVISPGPGNPSHTGICRAAIEYYQGRIPILGVCLGLQLIGEIYGAKVVRAPKPVHGQSYEIFHKKESLFSNLATPTMMARYHSLVLTQIPDCLEITAWTSDHLVMGLRHKTIPHLEGVQFHPESFMSEEGNLLMKTFLETSVQ